MYYYYEGRFRSQLVGHGRKLKFICYRHIISVALRARVNPLGTKAYAIKV
jgi:hypothetical protein